MRNAAAQALGWGEQTDRCSDLLLPQDRDVAGAGSACPAPLAALLAAAPRSSQRPAGLWSCPEGSGRCEELRRRQARGQLTSAGYPGLQRSCSAAKAR